MGFRCRTCGEEHSELPTAFHFAHPDPFFAIPQAERESRCLWNNDLCVIDDEHFFIHGLIEIPIIDSENKFVYGVWCSLSKDNFKRTHELWEQQGRESEPPYFGWLCNRVPNYPDTHHFKTMVYTRPVGKRPFIELEQTDHPLAVEQRQGISRERVQEIGEKLMHPA